MEKVLIAGKQLELHPMSRDELKGVFVDAKVGYDFYKTSFNNQSFYLLVSKRGSKLAPMEYKQLADRLEKLLGLPIVFLFNQLEYYQRNRLIEREVFFVVSDKYVFLPYLIINVKQADRKEFAQLTPVAQFLLLYHLQCTNLEGFTIKELESIVPYKYVTLTRAITCLEELHLCKSTKGDNRQKRVSFENSPIELWQKAQPYLSSPIKKTIFCDHLLFPHLVICGINALAHYSNLNPESGNMYAIEEDEFRKIMSSDSFESPNTIEGNTMIEVWKYPPITDHFVDKLSLYLTLKDDKDPRIEKELEIMINKLW